MKIYLGGKMDGHSRGNNWRNEIVSGVRADGDYGDEYSDGDGINLYAGCGAGVPPETWPVLPNAIFGQHDYVGPFLVACDHGCYHTGDHATSIEWGSEDKEGRKKFRDGNRQQIARLCTNAMLAADVLFFWIESLDAYGTLAELVFIDTLIGMANAINRQQGDTAIVKHIIVASPSFEAVDEMWLAFQLVKDAAFISAPTPQEALTTALASIEEPSNDSLVESPIEKKFMDRWKTIYGNGIVPQYNVPGFRYRVDFAFPNHRVAVELDGYEYHNSKEQFTNDRKRQREMEAAGWRFIRFSGSEVYNNAEACVRQTYEFWQSIAKEQ